MGIKKKNSHDDSGEHKKLPRSEEWKWIEKKKERKKDDAVTAAHGCGNDRQPQYKWKYPKNIIRAWNVFFFLFFQLFPHFLFSARSIVSGV